MNWLFFIVFMTADADLMKTELINEEVTKTRKTNAQEQTDEKSSEQPASQIHEPDMELLLFLAEWGNPDSDEWLDPETFSSENKITQQLDTQKAKNNETDPDHN